MAFGVAVSQKVLPTSVTSILYLVVALSMALIPYLAAMGGQLGALLEKSDTKALQPKEEETKVRSNRMRRLGGYEIWEGDVMSSLRPLSSAIYSS